MRERLNRARLGLVHLSQVLSHVILEYRLVVRVPSAKRRPSFGDVARIPHDTERIDLLARLVVRHKDVEVARAHAVEHVQDGFFGRPCTGRLSSVAGCVPGELGPSPARTVRMISV